MGFCDSDTVRDKIAGILEGLVIYDVVADALGRGNKVGQLRKKEDTYYSLCPFHKEKTPSFLVLPSVNGAGCLGCGTVLSPVRFMLDYYGDDWGEKILRIVRENDSVLFDSISEGRAFDSKDDLYEFVRDVGVIENSDVRMVMGSSLHCRAYTKKFLNFF